MMEYHELKTRFLEIVEACIDTCPDWFEFYSERSSIVITYYPAKDKVTISWCTETAYINGEAIGEVEEPHKQEKLRDKSGYIYVLRADNGRCKIGRAKRIDDRMCQLGVILPYDPELVCVVKVDDYVRTETEIHELFTDAGKHVKGEWFELNEADIEYIKALGA